ncbi:MAG TPA: DJ-1/PfpI family protein [Bacillota bacterium]|nr:DJ-1/PfpI family protein [Bacillota bacterium]
MGENRKIGILLENRFNDQEIIYYANRFLEEGYEVSFLTRLWGQPKVTVKGLELGMPWVVDQSFENISDYDLKNYVAMIVPSGYVADMLRYTERPGDLSPAVQFIKRIMEKKAMIKGFIGHGLQIFDPIPDSIRGRHVTCHNNIVGSLKNAGGVFVDEDIVIDEDVITARAGTNFARFARSIIDALNAKNKRSK